MIEVPICSGCAMEVEDVTRAFLGCKSGKVWKQTPFWNPITNTMALDFSFSDQAAVTSSERKDFELVMINIWSIRREKNKARFEKIYEDPPRILARAEAMLDSLITVLSSNPSLELCSPHPPKKIWFKLNVDAVIAEMSVVAGCGAVIINSNGEIMTAVIRYTALNRDVEYS